LYKKIGEKERAPLLAILELDNVLVKAGGESTMKDRIFEGYIRDYWGRWGSKGCVVSEIEGICDGEEWKVEKVEAFMRDVALEHVSRFAWVLEKADLWL
jgi:N-terminal acetyltransferase B complex non-catalytic subunit